jgi:hypothetical protein
MEMSVRKSLLAAAVPLLAATLVIGAAATSTRAESGAPGGAASGPLRCEIQKKTSGSMMSLAAVVHADQALSGSYTFRVTSGSRGGSSNVNQGGAFSAEANAAVTLGTVMLGADAAYTANLSVMSNGATVACSDNAGAI